MEDDISDAGQEKGGGPKMPQRIFPCPICVLAL